MGELIFKMIISILCIMGLFAGLILAVIGHITYEYANPINSDNSIETVANIISIDKSYDEYNETEYLTNYQVFVEYEVEGNTYQSELNAYSSEFEVGKQVDILYNRDDVTEIVYANIGSIVNIFNTVKIGGICLVVFCSLVLIIMSIKSKNKKKVQNEIIDTYDESMYNNGQFYTSKNNDPIKSDNNSIELNSDSSNDGAIKYK